MEIKTILNFPNYSKKYITLTLIYKKEPDHQKILSDQQLIISDDHFEFSGGD